ncbi:MAG: MFS transporter [Methanobacteriaceae archaeon]|jgi:EmrB/QacA subfamily drug resistance transporter|nr:MFS transporter [Methanobacteriaceae archaeon]
MALGTIMVPINSSIVNVSLPTITSFFSASVSTAEWILTSYLIVLLGLVLTFGKLGDLWGRGRLYIWGLVFFVVTSILCSIAPSINLLILFRTLQGIGAAMMISVSLGIVKNAFPVQERGKALGMYAVAIAAGLALGPAIGGLVESLGGWRAIFLVNVPLGVVSFISCYHILERGDRKSVEWDFKGTFLQFVGLFLIVYFLNIIEIPKITLESSIIGIIALIFLILFIWNEKVSKTPLLNLSLFKNRTFTAFNTSLLFNYLCMYMILFIMPFYLKMVLHLNDRYIGLILAVSPVVMMLMAPLSGYLSDKIGSRPLALTGSLICAGALYSMDQLTLFSSAYDVILRLGLLGLGAAIFQSPNNKAIMNFAPKKESGTISSIVVTMRNLGMVFGVSMAGLLLHTTISSTLLEKEKLFNLAAYDFTQGMHLVVLFGAVLSVAMAVLAVVGMPDRIYRTKKIVKEVKNITLDSIKE